MSAGRTAAVADVYRAGVAIIGTGCVVRFEAVRRAGCTCSCTALGHIAVTRRSTAHGAAGLEGIGRTAGARPRAGLRYVTGTRCRTTHRARVTRWMLARHSAAIALVQGTGVAIIRARCPRSLLGIRRATGARPVAALGHVAVSRRRTADRASVARRMGAGRTAAVADVFRA